MDFIMFSTYYNAINNNVLPFDDKYKSKISQLNDYLFHVLGIF